MSTGEWVVLGFCLALVIMGITLGVFWWWVAYIVRKERDKWDQ